MIRKENTMSDLQKREGNLKNRNCRNRVIFAAVCALMLAVAAAGCGKEEEGLQIEAIENGQEDTGNDAAENAGQEDAGSDAPEDAGQEDTGSDASEDAGQENTGNASEDNAGENAGTADGEKKNAAQSVGNAEIVGEVKRLSEDSFVISKVETWSEDGASFAASAAPGYEEEENLITVHVAESCAYEYKTVKNGGVNPEDISAREGSFTDLKEKLTVIIKGSWQEDGSFLADHIEMEEFI